MFKGAVLNGVDVSETPFELSRDVPDLVLTFTDRWSGIGGSVESAGRDSATVLAFTTDAQAWPSAGTNARRLRSARASATGQFGISSLPPGDYYVVAVPEEDTVDWRDPAMLETPRPPRDTDQHPRRGVQDPRTARAAGAPVIAALVLALLAQAAATERDTRPTPASASGAIVGTLTSDDPQPRPLRRARVTVNGTSLEAPRMVITADDGSFTVRALPAGQFTITAAKDGYVPMAYGATRTGRPGTTMAVGDRQSVSLVLRLQRGAVITGTVTYIDGQPAQGIPVAALVRRYLSPAGAYRYVPAGVSSGTTDDRGIYRIYGLPAGDYVIAAQPQTRNAGIATAEVRVMSGGVPSPARLVMTQVFHPGTTDVARAARLSVRAGEERAGIDLQLQYVAMATISGALQPIPGTHPSVSLVRVGEIAGVEAPRVAHPDADGRFTFASVPPGHYLLIARSIPSEPAAADGSSMKAAPIQTSTAEVIVDGEEVTGVALSPVSLITIAGRLAFEGARPAPDLGVMRLPATLAGQTIGNFQAPLPQIQLEGGGKFIIAGIFPGLYRMGSLSSQPIQGIRAPIGAWWLKAIVINGRDILDAPLDLRSSADDAVATFTDRASDLTGVARDAQGSPVSDAFVVVFATDRNAWFFNSRRVAGVRPDREGRYTIRNLPPGEYRIAATSDLEQGEWFDPAALGRLVTVSSPLIVSGPERQTLDLTIKQHP